MARPQPLRTWRRCVGVAHRMRGVEEERSEERCGAWCKMDWRCWCCVSLGEQCQNAAFQTFLRGANAMRRSVLLLGALCVVCVAS